MKPLVTDALWEHLEPLLPTPPPRRFRFPGRKLLMLQFLLMIFEIYTVIVLFVYVLHRFGKPEDLPGDGTQASNPPRTLM